MTHEPVCARCEIEMRPKENDVRVIDWFSEPPKPYQIWCADLWICPKCGVELVIGFGNRAFAEHYEEGFEDGLKNVKENYTVINNYE